jgi:hypothetical protein
MGKVPFREVSLLTEVSYLKGVLGFLRVSSEEKRNFPKAWTPVIAWR